MRINVYQTTRKEHLEYIKNYLITIKTNIENALISRDFKRNTSDRITYIANLYYIYLKICEYLENINDKRFYDFGENLIIVLIKTLEHTQSNVDHIIKYIREDEVKNNLKGRRIRFFNYIKQHEEYFNLLMDYKTLREKSSCIFYFLGFDDDGNFSYL